MAGRRSLIRSVLAGSLALGALAACSKSTHTATTTTQASGTTITGPSTSGPTSTAAPTTAGASTTTSGSTGAGCTTGSGTPPAGAHTKAIVDVDGDGKPDVAWMTPPDGNGVVRFGIHTAAGGGASIPFTSASPVERSALVVDADQHQPVEIILSDGRSASLHAFSGCAIKPVTNPQGQGYTFDLGDRIGTGSGIGCVQTSAGRRLVGLNIKPNSTPTVVNWTRTIIVLDGLTAHNGAVTSGTYHAPADQAQIALLGDISCGSQTIHTDGISTGP
ncbi:MAG: uncharacterized protein JWN46_626 [Acidimicrobiales bacterium]|nr:uncharacterized protein [Acidimicrobiales bacterium]